MNAQSAENYSENMGFPPLDTSSIEDDGVESKKKFVNRVYTQDSILTCRAFVNEIKPYQKSSEKKMHFIRIGYLSGSASDGNGGFENTIINCELLAGAGLDRFCDAFSGIENPLKGIIMELEIKNLQFFPVLVDNKPLLNARGIIETIKFGTLLK